MAILRLRGLHVQCSQQVEIAMDFGDINNHLMGGKYDRQRCIARLLLLSAFQVDGGV